MENAVHGCDCGLGEIMMSEFNCVGYLGRSGVFCRNCVASVVLEHYTNIPASCNAEVPRISCPYIFVCDYVAAEGSDGCSVIIEWTVEV